MRRKSNDDLIGCTALALYGLYFAFALAFMGSVIWLVLKFAGTL
jgi:hypothetical protein